MRVVVMKWFTREWHSGGLSDDEVDALQAGYWSHVDAVRSRLPGALQLFAGQPDEIGRADLHDGRVEWWALDRSRSFTLQVICGWVQIGYRRLVIQYRGRVELFGASESDVAGWLDDAETELLYDEVDIAADNRFEHRFLLWPRGEFGVRFEDAVVVSAPSSWGTYDLAWRRKRLESHATFERMLRTWDFAHWHARSLWAHLRDLRNAVSRSS
jgi:hypothetical protein